MSKERIKLILDSFEISDIKFALAQLGAQGNADCQRKMERLSHKINRQVLAYVKGEKEGEDAKV